MNAKVSSDDKIRVQIDLSPIQIARLNWTMKVCGLETRKDLFNNALTILEWAAKEVTEGRKIASFDKSDTKHILSMPALQTAASAHRSPEIATSKSRLVEV